MSHLSQARRVTQMSTLVLATTWIAAISSIPSARRYQQQLDQGVAAKDIATWFSTLSILMTLASIGAWFATISWMGHRYDENVERVRGSMRLSRRWIIWSWLLPIVSLWYPKVLIEDLLKSPKSASDIAGQPEKEPVNVRLWWATWVAYTIISNLMTVQLLVLPEDKVPFQPSYEIASACILTASYSLWINIVRKIG